MIKRNETQKGWGRHGRRIGWVRNHFGAQPRLCWPGEAQAHLLGILPSWTAARKAEPRRVLAPGEWFFLPKLGGLMSILGGMMLATFFLLKIFTNMQSQGATYLYGNSVFFKGRLSPIPCPHQSTLWSRGRETENSLYAPSSIIVVLIVSLKAWLGWCYW